MKASQIIAQLRAILPKFTTMFSETTGISSLSFSGGTVTAVTASAHGFSTGNYVNITGALAPNPITSLTRVGNVATAVCANVHDITEGFQTTVTIRGADQSEYNGEKTLIDVIDTKTFTFTVTGSPATPATGTILLDEDIIQQYNGRFEITVVNTTTFTYTITGTPGTPATGTIIASSGLRITGAGTNEKANTSYTEQTDGDYYLFVILGSTTANKERTETIDATYRFEKGADYRQTLIQNFSVLLFVPSTGEISGRSARDVAEDVRVFLIQALAGAFIDSGFDEGEKYGISFLNDDIGDYVNAYYIHQYNFEFVYNINRNDIVQNTDSKAWRFFNIDYERDADTKLKKEDQGKLPD